jgi:AcrR family transcriptional regulator
MSRVAAANREQYAEARRDQILNAALQVFSSRGFAETTMEEVATAAGLAKGSLYAYFEGKEILLEKLVQRYVLLPELPELVAAIRDKPPGIGIPILAMEVWRRFKERKELARVFAREIYSYPERAKLVTEHVALRGARAFAEYLAIWIERGKLKPVDPLATAQCLFGMLWSFLLSQELMGAKDLHPMSDAAICSTVSHVFLEGVASEQVVGPRRTARQSR